MRFFTPPKRESIHEPVIPMRSEESHKIYRTALLINIKFNSKRKS